MSTSLAHPVDASRELEDESPRVVVACPDSRPPAYQAAIGLARARRLDRLETGFYHRGNARLFPALDRRLSRRRDGEIPDASVRPHPSYDLALAFENRSGGRVRHAVARWRTRHFDRQLRDSIRRDRPDVLMAFSDVGSEFSLPYCKAAGIPAVLSMVHGDVREEVEILERERESSPEFFPIYLGDGPVDRRELAWLHDRRERDRALADLVLVPSDHIADALVARGTARERIAVIPYAADTRRFVPDPNKRHGDGCFFLFAGGITQRKGVGYLLEAWRAIRRPGWRLGLLGGLPRDTTALEPYRDEVEFLGRVGHSEMPSLLASADVFVFPSLFEGSAVVTYEALACGLPSVVTAESGSVARHGREGLVVPAADPEALAMSMARLGEDRDLRAELASSARSRAIEFGWPRYHRSIIDAIDRMRDWPQGSRRETEVETGSRK